MKFVYLILLSIFIASCSSKTTTDSVTTNSIVGVYYNDGKMIKAEFVLLKPETKPDANGIRNIALYGKVGEVTKGNFYWEKVAESYDDLALGRIPPTFKKNKLWEIE